VRNDRLVVIALTLVLGGVSLAQTAPPSSASSSSSGEFGASAIWHANSDFLPAAHAACDKTTEPAAFAECFIDQMAKAGAPQDALKFTRELHQSRGQIGIMGEFKGFGPIGLAWVVYPLRANDEKDGLLVLNGDPKFLDPDDLQRLDKAAMESDPLFLEWKKTVPQLDVWPGDRSAGAAQVRMARVHSGTQPGEQRFIFSYPIANGCKACARSGFVNYGWEFDAKGKFQGTRLLSVTRGVPPIKHDFRLPPQGVRAPADPKPSQPGTASTPPGEAPAPPH
jgi:hypothetical protein